MKTQLFFDLTGAVPCPSIHFREPIEVEEIMEELRSENVALFEIDGAAISSREALFKAFSMALKKPTGWYGDEEYASNANAFLEYLDDVHEWVPARGHVVVVRKAEQLWKTQAPLAGMLVELWQFATGPRKADIHLIFAW